METYVQIQDARKKMYIKVDDGGKFQFLKKRENIAYCKRIIFGVYDIWRKLVYEQVGVDFELAYS